MKRYIMVGVFLAAGGGHGVATAASSFFDKSDVNVHFSDFGEQTGSIFRFGFDVNTAGDLNGDGKLDFLVTGSGVIHVVTGN